VQELKEPSGPFVRVDSGIQSGSVIGTEYDPLLAKVSVWGENREQARARLLRALCEYSVLGIDNNLGFLTRLVADADFARGEYDTEFVERRSDLYRAAALEGEERDDWLAALAALEPGRAGARRKTQAGSESALSPWLLVERSRLR
jgi:acetyl/propionyl-CoA carboxylase alpha subunit